VLRTSASPLPTPTRSEETRSSRWWPVLVAAVAVLVYAPALRNGFALDDVFLVENNPAIASAANIPKLFLLPYWDAPGESYGLYRPLTIASLAVDRAVMGAGPLGFHLTNVLLHAGVAALAWFALRRAGTRYGTALAGAGLFAVLPVHSEAVANIAGRAELLAALFVLSAWLAHRRGNRIAAAALYFCALLSKESAILAPALFLLDDTVRDRHGIRALAPRYAGFAAALVVMLLLRVVALGPHQTAEGTIALDNPAAAAGFGPRIATALWVQLKYALVCVFPRRLVSDYSFDAIPVARGLGDPRALAGLAFAGAVFAAGAWGFARCRPLMLAAALWIVFALPSSNLLFPAGTIMAERLVYLPSLGICLAVGHAVASGAVGGSRVRRIAIVAATLVAVLGYSARIIARIPDWKNNLALATADVAIAPRSAKLQAGAGIFLADAGRAAEAEDHLRRAVAIYPDYAQMHYNLAVLLARRGARDEAIEHLNRAIALAPGNPLPQQLLQRLR
jgi:tetratricopeptide (TPR) repeat protein